MPATSRRARYASWEEFLGRLHWMTWNSTDAHAWGADSVDDCSPGWFDGTPWPSDVNRHAFRPRVVSGCDEFTPMTVTPTHRRAPYAPSCFRKLEDGRGSLFWCVTGPC